MGQLTVTEFVTLDGIAQAPGGPDEDREDGFGFGGWQAPFVDEATGMAIFERARDMDVLLLGRRTYELFAAYWPDAPEEMPFTGLINGVTKYVASRTLSGPLTWNRSTVLDGDLVDAVTVLEDRHDSVKVIGSLDLVQSLLSERLVDRIELWIHPVVIGTGKRVFEPGTLPTTFELLDSVTYPTGVVHLDLAVAGDPVLGDMAERGS